MPKGLLNGLQECAAIQLLDFPALGDTGWLSASEALTRSLVEPSSLSTRTKQFARLPQRLS